MSRKKVFFVLPVMKGGGAEKVASILINHLDRTKYALSLVLFNKEGEYLDTIPPDVEIIDLAKRSRFDFVTLVLKLRRLIRARKPDLVVSSLYYPNIITVLAVLLARTGCKVVVTEHSNHVKLLPYKRFASIVRLLMSFTYRRAHRIVAVSKCVRNDLAVDFKIGPEPFRVIYNPLEWDAIEALSAAPLSHPFFDDGRERFVVVGVGRLTRAKNYDMLIEAVASARHKIPASLLLVGHGELEEDLKQRVRELKMDAHVDFVGFQENPYQWMKRSDLFVMSSSWEGFGIVIAEAMACGVPVISTACHGGTNEIVTDGENGRVVPVGDSDALAAAIVEIAEDKAHREEMVRKGLERARGFDCTAVVARYEEVLDELFAS